MQISRPAKRMLSVLITGGAVFGATALVSSPPASAQYWDQSMKSDDGDPGAVIRFKEHGDVVQVCDIEKDDWAAYGTVVWFNSSGERKHYNLRAGGFGSCYQKDADNYNLPEHKSISFRICLQNKQGLDYCDYAKWTNNG
ncbi:hypothetical protein [Actinomadura montaniterrae]|uniref:Uncharacterized protein n=1 Tax=Actinomadura montaniterrae TaxID=1803903 RepID=A0A6L3VU76_9ACTN|nr:hypothetical protein [Actinomadura montaniterrae]KAB2376431.1 hypothetical protein F9B16_25185 [Actinomadura montaniterrae]